MFLYFLFFLPQKEKKIFSLNGKVVDRCWGRPEGSLFNSYYSEVLLSLDCSTLPLIRTLYCWLLSKKVSNTIFKVFGITRPGIEPRSPGPLTNTVPTRNVTKKNFFLSFFFLILSCLYLFKKKKFTCKNSINKTIHT